MACTSNDLGELVHRVFERNFSYRYDAEISQSITNMVMKHYFDRRHTTKALLLLELNFIYDSTIGIISPRTWERTRRWDSATQALSPFLSMSAAFPIVWIHLRTGSWKANKKQSVSSSFDLVDRQHF